MTVTADEAPAYAARWARGSSAGRAARLCLLGLLLLAAGCADDAATDAPRGERGAVAEGGQRTATPALDAGIDDSFVIAPPTLSRFTGDLPAMRERGVLRALVVPSRTDFFLDHGAVKGIQAEYLRELERFLNRDVGTEVERIRVQYVPTPFAELIPALRAGRGDVVAAFLTPTAAREGSVAFIDAMALEASEVVVRHRDAAAVAARRDLAGREVVVLKGSSYAQHLEAFNGELAGRGLPPVDIVTADRRLRSEDILELVNAGAVELTVIDDYKARLWAEVLPDVVVEPVELRRDTRPGWAVRPQASVLEATLERFAESVSVGTLVGNVLFARYFENDTWVRDATARDARDRLAEHIELFRKYGTRYGFDALEIAAQAYQESGLDHAARSRRGAVGIMQIRPATARDPKVAIADVGKLENNIHAATKYLAFLRDRYFSDPDIAAWDRRALTWAAYNTGPADVRRARARATELGLDADVWFGNVEVAMAETVGREPVRYVASTYIHYTAYKLLQARREARRAALERGDFGS